MKCFLRKVFVVCFVSFLLCGIGSCQLRRDGVGVADSGVNPNTVYPRDSRDAVNHVVKYLQDLLGNMPAGIYYSNKRPSDGALLTVQMVPATDGAPDEHTKYNLNGDIWVAGYNEYDHPKARDIAEKFIASAEKLRWGIDGRDVSYSRFFIPGGYVLILELNNYGNVTIGFSTPPMPREENLDPPFPDRITFDDPVVHI